MRIKIAKVLATLTVALIPQFIFALFSTFFFPTLWWFGFFIAFIVAVFVHEPTSKWVENHIPR